MREVDQEMTNLQTKNSSYFVEWIPNNVKTAVCNVPPKEHKIAGTFVGNNTSIKAMFGRTRENFHKMFKRKAYVHWYTGEGMDESELMEADSNVRDLCDEYQTYETIELDDDTQFSDGEEEEIISDSEDMY